MRDFSILAAVAWLLFIASVSAMWAGWVASNNVDWNYAMFNTLAAIWFAIVALAVIAYAGKR